MTGPRIAPEDHGPSGAFAALERTAPIAQADANGVPTTTSMRVANGTRNEHASVLRLIRDNLADFEEFGLVRFEIRPRPAGQHGGGDVHVAILNEDQANRGVFIGKGSMRNTPYQQYMHHFEVKAHEYERSNGEIGCSYTTYVQPSGIDFIRRKLDLPSIDPLFATPGASA